MQHDHPKEAWVFGMLGLSFETRISKASSTDRARNNQATPMAKAQTIRKNWKLKCSCTPMPLAHRSTTESTKFLVLPLYQLYVVFFLGGVASSTVHKQYSGDPQETLSDSLPACHGHLEQIGIQGPKLTSLHRVTLLRHTHLRCGVEVRWWCMDVSTN